MSLLLLQQHLILGSLAYGSCFPHLELSCQGCQACLSCKAWEVAGAELKRFVPPGSPGEGEKGEGGAEELHFELSVTLRGQSSLSFYVTEFVWML